MSRPQTEPLTHTSSTPATQKVPYRWRNLGILSGTTIVDNTEAGLVNGVFPSIAATLRLDTSHLGIIAALGKVASVPAGPFWVWLATKIGRRGVLVLTTFLCGVFGIGAALSQGFASLLVFTTLMAMAAIGGSPISMAVISDSFGDRLRSRAMSYYFAGLQLAGLIITPLLALFLTLTDGWRYAMGVLAGVCFIVGLLVLAFFREPGIGAADRLEGVTAPKATAARVPLRRVLGLFKIPSYAVMMISRLLSGHLLIIIFGVQFLVTERGIDNALAVIVALPFGLGYTIGTLSIGAVLPTLEKKLGESTRVLVLQLAQLLFGVAAFFATQVEYSGFIAYALLWAAMGACQGLNPPVNRPLVAAVVLPELRGQAFAIWLSVFETIAWAIFAILAGSLAATLGLQSVLFWVLVVLMVVNAAFLSILYVTYPRDVQRVRRELEARSTEAAAN